MAIVKTRKKHRCDFCNRIIPTGEKMEFWKTRIAEYDKDDIQVGIKYMSGYLCHKEDVKCIEG